MHILGAIQYVLFFFVETIFIHEVVHRLKLISLRTLPLSLICFHAYHVCSPFFSKWPVVVA